jgi:acyl-coenzyme A synthetase/AMP-(fatty) acid ligase
MHIDFLLDVFRAHPNDRAIVWRDEPYTYGWLLDAVARQTAALDEHDVPAGAVVSLEADFSPTSVAMLLALIERSAVLVPLTDTVQEKKTEFRDIGEVETVITIGEDDHVGFESTGRTATHEHYRTLRERNHPGLVLFSSGSTGASKAAVHDLSFLLNKFKVPRQKKCTITFLLFDHIGGINTLLYTLSNAGCVVTLGDRAPDAVCQAIDTHGVQILPTSPTFLNLLLLSEAYRNYGLKSLELVTYGTEAMPESTLKRFCTAFPHVRMQQTYGLSEVGILRSKSRANDSLWVKVGGEDYETRVVDGLLEIKAKSAMLGYLNAPSPFTPDGWFMTGDEVEVDGDYLRILGRRSEMINVGGAKVFPIEVENVIQQMEGVEDVAVSGERNPITGSLVKARVKLSTDETLKDFRKRMNTFCKDRLERFKIPQKVEFVAETMHGARYKKMRREEAGAGN